MREISRNSNLLFRLVDRKIHSRYSDYEHVCEKIVADKLAEMYRLESEGYNVMDFSLDMCEVNGWYKRIREDRHS